MAEYLDNQQQEQQFSTIEGPDSEEILGDLYQKYADRNLVLFHRAVVAGNVDKVTESLAAHPEWLESTLFPHAAFDTVRQCNAMDYDEFTRYGLVEQTSKYPEVPQFISGDSDIPNELFPTGEYDEPETNLDTVFWTPLMRACYSGSTEMISLLVDAGADKDFRSPCQANVITACLRSFHFENLSANLLLVRSDTNVLFKDYLLEVMMNEDLGNSEIVQTLLDCGVPVDKDSELFQGDWRSWIDPDVVAVLEPYLL